MIFYCIPIAYTLIQRPLPGVVVPAGGKVVVVPELDNNQVSFPSFYMFSARWCADTF